MSAFEKKPALELSQYYKKRVCQHSISLAEAMIGPRVHILLYITTTCLNLPAWTDLTYFYNITLPPIMVLLHLSWPVKKTSMLLVSSEIILHQYQGKSNIYIVISNYLDYSNIDWLHLGLYTYYVFHFCSLFTPNYHAFF